VPASAPAASRLLVLPVTTRRWVLTDNSWALQVRWFWLRKTDTSKPWLSLDIPIHANVAVLFQIALQTTIGSGSTTKFWTDRWIHGNSINDLAPTVFAAVPTRARNIRLVADALVDHI